MAVIDFPNNPSEGDQYAFGGTTYSFTIMHGAPGYWHISEPGLAGPASIAELNAGVDSFKYATSSGLAGSQYIRGVKLSANGGSFTTVDDSDTMDFTSSGGAGGLSIARNGTEIQVRTSSASTVTKGVVQLDGAYDGTSTTKAPTAGALGEVWAVVAASAFAKTNFGDPAGQLIIADDRDAHNNGGRIAVKWGTHTVSGTGTQTVQLGGTNHAAYIERCYFCVLQPQVNVGTDIYSTNLKSLGTSTCTFRSDVPSGNFVRWLAVGKVN